MVMLSIDRRPFCMKAGGAVFLLLSVGAAATGGGPDVVCGFDFELPGSALSFALGKTPEGLNDLTNCRAVIVQRGPAEGECISGTHAYRLALSFPSRLTRATGYAYPTAYLSAPIILDEPLYFSGYLKITEQDPESELGVMFLVWGEYPHDPQPTLGKLHTAATPAAPKGAQAKLVWKGANTFVKKPREWKEGWQFFHSADLREAMAKREDIKVKDGMCVFGVSVCVAGCRPGTAATLLVDDVRFTRTRVVLPPDPEEVERALATFERIGHEFSRLAGRYGDEATRRRNTAAYARAAGMVARARRPHDAEARSEVVAGVREMAEAYYSLKVFELSDKD